MYMGVDRDIDRERGVCMCVCVERVQNKGNKQRSSLAYTQRVQNQKGETQPKHATAKGEEGTSESSVLQRCNQPKTRKRITARHATNRKKKNVVFAVLGPTYLPTHTQTHTHIHIPRQSVSLYIRTH